MSDLVFSTYLREVQKAWKRKISDQAIIQLFYDAIAKPMGYNIEIRVDAASKIMNRKPGGNVRDDIREGSSEDKVLDEISEYFEKEITSCIAPRKEDALIERLTRLINEDEEITEAERNKILDVAQRDTFNDFLLEIYLYTVTVNNVLSGTVGNVGEMPDDSEEDRELAVLPVPADIMEEERGYAKALLAVYKQLRQTDTYDFVTLDLYEEDKKDFVDHREYYFAAEALRRGTRDSRHGEGQFDVLKREIYEGVKEIWRRHYTSGSERLDCVLNESTKANISQCVLSRKTNWIGNLQRKGVCHFLVNDGKIEGWVRDDDG